MQKARRHPFGLRPLVGARFQVLFHSPNRGAFHLSLALLFTIGHQGVLSLARWAALLHARFHGTGATQEICWRSVPFAYGAVTLFGGPFQGTSVPPPLEIRLSRLQFAVRCTEITILGFGLFTRRY